MKDTPKPVSKASMDPKFEGRLRDLQEHAQTEHEKRVRGLQVKWFRPDDWGGDLFDYEGMHNPFNRDKANQDYIDSVKDPKAPGTVGDVVITTTMIETLACFERAFRQRHTMRRPRAMAHMLGRKRGHGLDTGPLIQLGVEYIRNLLRQTKVPQ